MGGDLEGISEESAWRGNIDRATFFVDRSEFREWNSIGVWRESQANLLTEIAAGSWHLVSNGRGGQYAAV